MSGKKHTFIVEGMTCTGCAAGVKKVIEKNGGENVNVNFSTNEAEFSAHDSSIKKIEKSINSSGYKVVKQIIEGATTKIEKLFYFCLVFTLPLVGHMFVDKHHFLNNIYFQIILSSIVVFTGGIHFLKSAFSSLKIGVPNMDVLISIGSFSAYFYSLYGSYIAFGTENSHDFMFFETAATIITLVLLGNVIEHRSVNQTTSALKDLKNLQPNQVNKVNGDNITIVDIASINIGDTIQINQGDRIPLDGTIISGEAEIDESLITGESVPVFKTNEEQVYSGALIISGNIQIKITNALGGSTIDGIVDMVKNAQSKRPEIQKIGDRVSAIFVPSVLGISILTFIISWLLIDLPVQQCMMHAIAVLVISCPCAMGLAAPTAVMVGIGRAAKNGILIKGGDTLEKLAKVETIIFDKTGTLTTGEFDIDRLNTYKESTEKVKQIILALEQKSSHPIAKSLTKVLSEEIGPIHLFNVQEIKGAGMKGTDEEGHEYHITSAGYASNFSTRKFTADLILFQNGSVIGELWVKDRLKTGIKETIQEIKDLGIRVIIMSGDKENKVSQTATSMHFDEYHSEQTPKDKLELVKRLNKHSKTIMIGDGINDAPALAAAYTGISFGNATDVAITASEVVLLNKDIGTLLEALKIGKASYKTIKQNFFWAFFYNTLAIPVAAFGFLIPMFAALSMAFSDVIVIGNSIRLKFKRL